MLDHGYVEFVESWGSDERIIEAARMSTAKGFLGWGPKCDRCGNGAAFDVATGKSQVAGDECPAIGCGGKLAGTGDEKLLRYLWTHKHTTPFEMAGFTIEVQAPIFVFREWHRHRTQCLAGDTPIPYFSPRGTSANRSIRQLFELKAGIEDSAPIRQKNGFPRIGSQVTRVARRKDAWRTRILPNCQTRVLRTINEMTGEVSFGQTADIYESGQKEIFSLNVTNNLRLRASATHPILTTEGWVHLADLSPRMLVATAGRVPTRATPIPPALRNGIGVWTTMMRSRLIRPVDACYKCHQSFLFDELELDHIIPVRERLDLALTESNLAPICVSCHRAKTDTEQGGRKGQMAMGRRWEMVTGIPVRVAEEMTYDIEMSGPNRNFVAGGIFVHNSYNELSARYTPLPDVNYVPSVERLMMQNDGKNRQSSGIAAVTMTTNGAEAYRAMLVEFYAAVQRTYETALGEGLPKEIARIVLPVGRYSRMRASTDLWNWLHFLRLRLAPDAQWEIRQYAQAVDRIVGELFPRTHALFAEAR